MLMPKITHPVEARSSMAVYACGHRGTILHDPDHTMAQRGKAMLEVRNVDCFECDYLYRVGCLRKMVEALGLTLPVLYGDKKYVVMAEYIRLESMVGILGGLGSNDNERNAALAEPNTHRFGALKAVLDLTAREWVLLSRADKNPLETMPWIIPQLAVLAKAGMEA